MFLLSASFVDCKKEDDGLNDLAVLSALSGGGDCVVDFPGKAAVTVNRTRVTKGGSATVTWGRIPFVNHPIAIVEILGAQSGNTVVFNGADVVENPQASGEATVYAASNCPLAESDIIDGFDAFNSGTFGDATPGPYTWTNTVDGSYYFLLYIVGTTEISTTVTYSN
ncbi:LIC20153 family lipoprotein [Leptospira koniambonensis]|uniref:LIC20153 family lipoprotein n=1 Tax=Leptospira koniambonensis TaxID=2484950 RepID=UPI003EB73260